MMFLDVCNASEVWTLMPVVLSSTNVEEVVEVVIYNATFRGVLDPKIIIASSLKIYFFFHIFTNSVETVFKSAWPIL